MAAEASNVEVEPNIEATSVCTHPRVIGLDTGANLPNSTEKSRTLLTTPKCMLERLSAQGQKSQTLGLVQATPPP